MTNKSNQISSARKKIDTRAFETLLFPRSKIYFISHEHMFPQFRAVVKGGRDGCKEMNVERGKYWISFKVLKITENFSQRKVMGKI